MPKMVLETTINGEAAELLVQPYATLLEALRETAGLTGAKEGCGTGDCGACTVHVDGKPVASCLMLAMQVAGPERPHRGRAGLRGRLAPPGPERVREARRPAVRLLHPRHDHVGERAAGGEPGPDEDEIRLGIAGNLCRCTGYTKMVAAIVEASRRLEREADRWQP